MADKRNPVIAPTLLAGVCSVALPILIWAIPILIWRERGRSTRPSGTGISAYAGGIPSWLAMCVIGGVGLAICFAVAACVALLVTRRGDS